MKRNLWTGALVAVSMALVLAGCSSNSSSEASSAPAVESAAPASEAPASEAPAAAEPLTIGVSFYSQQIPLFGEMLEGVNDLAAEKGVEIIFSDGGGSAEEQTNQIENMITNGVDAIIASPVASNSNSTCATLACSANNVCFCAWIFSITETK